MIGGSFWFRVVPSDANRKQVTKLVQRSLLYSNVATQAGMLTKQRVYWFPKMSRGSAFSFLCDCLSSIPADTQLTPNLLSSADWSAVTSLAHEYRVSAALAWALEKASPKSSLPRGIRSFFASLAARQRQSNERVRDEIVEVGNILNGIGVVPLQLKGGAHLFADLYPDPAIRQMADLDILVLSSRLDESVMAMKKSGLVELSSYQHPRAHHHAALGRDDLVVPIELHHDVLACPHGTFLTSKEMFASSLQVTKHGVRIALPSATHAVIHNIAHAQLNDHDSVYGRIDLRGLLDLALLSNVHAKAIDWDEVYRRFIDARHQTALEYHMHWARRLGAKVPSRSRMSVTSKLLYRRAAYQVLKPNLTGLSVRLLRPLVLLRRELSDSLLRRRLAGNLLTLEWWRRHLRMLTDA